MENENKNTQYYGHFKNGLTFAYQAFGCIKIRFYNGKIFK